MATKQVSMSLPEEIIELLDHDARGASRSRSWTAAYLIRKGKEMLNLEIARYAQCVICGEEFPEHVCEVE